jgi:hypothetical protein
VAAIREAGRQDAPLLLGLIQESFETLYRRVGLTPLETAKLCRRYLRARCGV